MSFAPIVRESGREYREQLTTLVNDHVDSSWQDSRSIRRRWIHYYDLNRGIWTGRYHRGKHNVHIPIMHTVVEASTARQVQTSLGVFPPWAFRGAAGEEDVMIARKWEGLVGAQARDAHLYQKAFDFFKMAKLYGTAISRHGWDFKSHHAQFRDTTRLPVSNRIATTLRSHEVVTFNGPNVRPIDNLDFFPQAGIARMEDMERAAELYTLSLEQARDLVEDGVFDKPELKRLEQEGGGQEEAIENLKNLRGHPHITGLQNRDDRPGPNFERLISCVDFVGRIPRELALPGGFDRVLLTVANKRFLLRAVPIPWFDQKLPWLAYSPSPDPHFFWGVGAGELLAKIQLGANKFTNQTLDAIALAIDPAMVVSRRANITDQNLRMRPGRIFLTDGSPQDNWMPLPMSLQGIQLGPQATEMLWRWGQQGTGVIEDTVLGGPGGDRVTAREFTGRVEAVSTRLGVEARLGEMNWLEPLGDAFVSQNQQFLDAPHEFSIMGQSAQVDPVTGDPIPGERATLFPEEMTRNYTAQAIGATSRLGLAVKQQNLIALTQAMSANPAAASAINWIGWAKLLARVFELPEAASLINTSEGAQGLLEQLTSRGQSLPETNGLLDDGTAQGLTRVLSEVGV